MSIEEQKKCRFTPDCLSKTERFIGELFIYILCKICFEKYNVDLIAEFKKKEDILNMELRKRRNMVVLCK